MLGFTRDEYVEAFRHLGVARAEAADAADRLVASPGTMLDVDVLAALSLVSVDCERRARRWLETVTNGEARTRLTVRFARARLEFGGRVDPVK